MHHWIQLGLLFVGIFLLAIVFSQHEAYGDGAIVQAFWEMAAVAVAAILIIVAVLWFLIGGILGF